jgi:hypothetical protein
MAERSAAEIAPGLWRWTAAHPGWTPDAEPGSAGEWDPDVGCVLTTAAPDHAVFVDPLVPAEADAFWHWCDEAVGSRLVSVLTTIRFHGRSRDAVAARYSGEVVTSLRRLPPGVEAFRFREADETMFWLPVQHALVPGDRIIGNTGGGVRLCPDSWLEYLHEHADALGLHAPIRVQADLRAVLRPLLDLPVHRILVSHGEPVLAGGAAALERILA